MPQDQVTLRVFSHHCWTVALIGQSVCTPNCLHQIIPLTRPAIQQSEMLLLSRISPIMAAADSRVSPYPMGRANHKRRFYISLPNLHNGRPLGHSSRSLSLFVFFSCIAFTSCFLSLSFISLVPLLQLSSPRHSQVKSRALFTRPILHSSSDPYHRRCYCYQIASSLLSRYLTYTCDVFSCHT